ncbi:MAG TPA: DNA polymerase III subunit chi [Allosphingosinicella sp.]|jgi:DNA polymerase-3 subunit chi|uniref:DNA polymerase III subunit chi n=1 Tax=Allosphingosinicella sp. TaxID=2823234 RepID=UPI002F27F90B
MLVDFYHLEASPLERVLPSICDKILAGGERLLIVAETGELPMLDELLWTYAADSFLPHARRERPNPELQPILLSDTPEPLNGATNVALGDGRWRDEALGFARTFYLFGSTQVGPARAAWRTLKSNAAVQPRYWKQEERGKWFQSA